MLRHVPRTAEMRRVCELVGSAILSVRAAMREHILGPKTKGCLDMKCSGSTDFHRMPVERVDIIVVSLSPSFSFNTVYYCTPGSECFLASASPIPKLCLRDRAIVLPRK